MNKEELFLKYIDEQSSQEEKLQVDLLLSESENNQQIFKKVKSTRENVLQDLDFLNPTEPVIIPEFDHEQDEPNNKKTIHIKVWNYAAMAAILLGIYFGYKYLKENKEDQIAKIIPENVKESKTIYKELDCYISPNRCWNQKQLVWTIIEINH